MNNSRLSTIAFGAYAVLLLMFLFAPIAVVVLFSFDSKGTAAFPFEGPTTAWYLAVASDPIFANVAASSCKPKKSLAMFGSTAANT